MCCHRRQKGGFILSAVTQNCTTNPDRPIRIGTSIKGDPCITGMGRIGPDTDRTVEILNPKSELLQRI